MNPVRNPMCLRWEFRAAMASFLTARFPCPRFRVRFVRGCAPVSPSVGMAAAQLSVMSVSTKGAGKVKKMIFTLVIVSLALGAAVCAQARADYSPGWGMASDPE